MMVCYSAESNMAVKFFRYCAVFLCKFLNYYESCHRLQLCNIYCDNEIAVFLL